MLTQMLHLSRQLPVGYFRGFNADYVRLHGVVIRDSALGILSIPIERCYREETSENRSPFNALCRP